MESTFGKEIIGKTISSIETDKMVTIKTLEGQTIRVMVSMTIDENKDLVPVLTTVIENNIAIREEKHGFELS